MVDLTYKDNVLCARLYGEIDHHLAPGIRGSIDAQIETCRPDRLELDFSAVTFMDSSGIGLVMGRYRAMSLIGGRVDVVNIPKSLERMFALSGLSTLGVLR